MNENVMLYFRWRTACRMPFVWAADQGFYGMLARLTYPQFRWPGGAL